MTDNNLAAKDDSLRKRYAYKLGTNLLGLLINLVTQAIIPRGLGPKAYGDFNFITNFFTQVIGFFDSGTSIGFYNKLSQRPKESTLVTFYLYFSGVISSLLLLFVAAMAMTSAHDRLWPGQELIYIYMGTVWGILNWTVVVLNKMADAYGITVSAEIVRIFQKILGLILIVVLYLYQWLNLSSFFYYQFILFFVLCLAFIWVIERHGYSLRQGWRLSHEEVRGYIREFYQYSHPLFSYALLGLCIGLLDRWLLQTFAGSVQQGFYSLSYQIGAICFLFTSAMTPLLTREFAIAFGNNDLTKMAVLFRRYIPLLYATAAYFSCFIAVQADKVVYLMGGSDYNEALFPVIIMAFYPVHQTYGQLSGAVFYATGQTSLYRNVGITLMLVGLPLTYLLIAPREFMGLNAGSTGLAMKMVIIQFIGVNVQLYYNAKLLKLSFIRYFGHQLVSIGCLLLLAAVATMVIGHLPILSGRVLEGFILSGILYSMLVAGMLYSLPIIFGLTREDIKSVRVLVENKFLKSK